MFTQSTLMFLYAETSVHVGGGESVGAIDLAIAREKYTSFPFIPSSGVKGAIRDWFESNGKYKFEKYSKDTVLTLFGGEDGSDGAGNVIFTDARLLLFPVKSLKGIFAWITCPFALERLQRDRIMAGITETFTIPKVNDGNVICSDTSSCLLNNKEVILEEYVLEKVNSTDFEQFKKIVEKAMPQNTEYNSWRARLDSHLLILSDNDFTDFVKSSTEVQTRIKLGEGKSADTKKGGNLFYQENLPADSLLYCVVGAQKPHNGKDGLENAESVLEKTKELDSNRVQFGGNESIGKGIFTINFLNK